MLIGRWGQYLQGPEARPIQVLAQYGLLTRDIAVIEKNINIKGGTFHSTLVAACWWGHQDAVGILLENGADPRFGASHRSGSETHGLRWCTKDAPLVCAVYNQDLPVLRHLLNAQRPFPTLQEWLRFSSKIRKEKPPLEAFLALLFPEATFPDSVIHDLCEALGHSECSRSFWIKVMMQLCMKNCYGIVFFPAIPANV